MSAISRLRDSLTGPDSGWDRRLWLLWALNNAIAFAVVLAIVYGMSSLSLDVTKIAVNDHLIGTLLIATAGALVYGVVLGSMQWRVLRERIPIERRRWIVTCAGPALLAWVLIVVPAAVSASNSGENIQAAYVLAASQALALGPLLGLTQANSLRPYTRRWKSWIAANVVSWLLVDAVVYLISQLTGHFDYTSGNGSTLEVFLMLLAVTPLTGRWILWVTAPVALTSQIRAPDLGSTRRVTTRSAPRRSTSTRPPP